MGVINTAFGIMNAQQLAGDVKRMTRQQRAKRINAPVPPGGVPNMSKISARQGLRSCLANVRMRKEAAKPLSNMLRAFPRAFGYGLGIAGSSMLAYGGAKGVAAAHQKIMSARMFKRLQQIYPEIKRHPKAREYFDLIIAYAPSLLRHPAAVGDFLRRQLEYPMSSVEFIKQLADLEGAVAKTQSYSAPSRFGEAVAKGMGSSIGPIAEGLPKAEQSASAAMAGAPGAAPFTGGGASTPNNPFWGMPKVSSFENDR